MKALFAVQLHLANFLSRRTNFIVYGTESTSSGLQKEAFHFEKQFLDKTVLKKMN
jgi:hypothetical protein